MDTDRTMFPDRTEEADQQSLEYATRMRDRAEELVPHLLRVDQQSLSRLEEAFQENVHKKLYSLRFDDRATVMEVHALIKGARAFLTWIHTMRRRTEG